MDSTDPDEPTDSEERTDPDEPTDAGELTDSDEPTDPDERTTRQRDEGSDRTDADRGHRGRLDRLRELLVELESRGKVDRAGRVETAGGVVDYRYSIMSGFADPPSDRRRLQKADADTYLVTTRQDGAEFVVVADLTDVEPADLAVGLDDEAGDDALVIAVDGRAVEQVPLPSGSVVTDASFSNQILEVRMRPIEAGTDASEDGGRE